jgi:hypothetical protein
MHATEALRAKAFAEGYENKMTLRVILNKPRLYTHTEVNAHDA